MLDRKIQGLVSAYLCSPVFQLLIECVDMHEGTIASMKKLGITESFKLKRQVVISASEATEMILRFAIPRVFG